MSRGPGKIEQALANTLTSDWQTMRELATTIHTSPEPSRAAIESVRRACRKMVERGTVELDYIDTGYNKYDSGGGTLWSSLGEGRDAYTPGHRPAASCWELVARKC